MRNPTSYIEIPSQPMRECGDILDAINFLRLPEDGYFVIGGANMVLRGIKLYTPDVDMLVSDEVFSSLQQVEGAKIKQPPQRAVQQGATNSTVWVKNLDTPIPISATTALGDGYYPMTYRSHKRYAEDVQGVPCLRLNLVRRSKEAIQRPKDIKDLQLIYKSMGVEVDLLPEPTVYEPVLES